MDFSAVATTVKAVTGMDPGAVGFIAAMFALFALGLVSMWVQDRDIAEFARKNGL
jgi:hypothetical protein